MDPSPKQRQQIERLLDGLKPMALPMDAAEFLQYLQSQDLEVEERVRQYLSDARDLLEDASGGGLAPGTAGGVLAGASSRSAQCGP